MRRKNISYLIVAPENEFSGSNMMGLIWREKVGDERDTDSKTGSVEEKKVSGENEVDWHVQSFINDE